MSDEILINIRPSETRVAYVENGILTDLKVERKRSPTQVGGIYRGKVIRVLPGMQAAFVDIGLDRAAFLFAGDVRSELELQELEFLFNQDVDNLEIEDGGVEEKEQPILLDGALDGHVKPDRPPIEDMLHEGQIILVQVAKDPLGTKGARVTMHISLPGRYIVYMPTLQHHGISRRIEENSERERLKEFMNKLKDHSGIIIRTAGEGAPTEKLKDDLKYLKRLWKDVYRTYEKKKAVGLVHSELDMELRAVRDLINENIRTVWVDDEASCRKIHRWVSQFLPVFKNQIIFYQDQRPLFDLYGIELEISRSMERKVWLKSGGYIVIDEAEALTVVDVNTGRYVGKKDFEDTILKTNLEAVKEIAHQLRIRNCGGIIIIDFIDMEKELHREKVLEAINEELNRDPVRTNVIGMSDLGLVEMTRKRIRPSLIKSFCESCTYCDGKGYIKRKSTIANEIFRELERDTKIKNPEYSPVVHCHSEVVDWIYEEETETVELLEARLGRSIAFLTKPEFHIEQYEIIVT